MNQNFYFIFYIKINVKLYIDLYIRRWRQQYNNVNVFMSSFGANTGDSNAITMCRDTILSYSMYSPMFIKTWLQHLSKKIFN